MALETNRILGGVGAILMFIGIIPVISTYGIIELVGLILVLVALYNLAGYYREGGIFNNALYGLIVAIVGGVVSVVMIIFTVLTSLTDFLYKLFPGWNGDWAALSGLTPNTANISFNDVLPLFSGLITVFIVFWIFSIITAFLVRRSLTSLSIKAGVGLFSTTGLLFLIGAVLIIIFGLGLILVWISLLLLAIAFFQIKPQETHPAPAPTTPTQT